MRRPNPTFLKKAEGIKSSRKKRMLIIILVALVIAFIVVFINSIASAQDMYRLQYPGLIGAATSTTTEYSAYQRPVHTTTETTTEVTTTATTTLPHAVLAASPTPSPSPEELGRTQNNSPDIYVEDPNFSFQPIAIQTASYQQRAVMLDDLKEQVTNYQKSHTNLRICYEFISLTTGERMGVDELDPVVPSGAMSIPVSIVLYDKVAGVTGPLSEVITYNVSKNDSIALNYVIAYLGGTEEVLKDIKKISGYISYDDKVIYTDYSGKEYRTSGTISCYDMGQYLSYMYHTFTINPSVNQRLFNDMASNEVGSPLAAAFPQGTKILHVLGRNTERKAYMECAIVDYKEPFAIVIYVEAASSDSAGTAIATLGSYTQKFIEACYK